MFIKKLIVSSFISKHFKHYRHSFFPFGSKLSDVTAPFLFGWFLESLPPDHPESTAKKSTLLFRSMVKNPGQSRKT
ncbi:hypothetical protein V6Z12_A06G181400 [Gossypium hirsutum]